VLTTVDYYNGFRDRLVNDYAVRNSRVVAALAFAQAQLEDARTVLDVGCGIGWTTHELANNNREVIGLDISPVLVHTARTMFPAHTFIAADFTSSFPVTVDAVVMIDVYEHFPRYDRPTVHRQIQRTGARRVVLTVPTPEALQYARDNHIPLQPVDEDVTDTDIDTLARDIGGDVTTNELVSISRPNDYRHVLITC
jgi:trans-aconitate methyltransferase